MSYRSRGTDVENGAPGSNMKYIGCASAKISHRTGSADLMIFNLFSAKDGPGLRIQYPGFAAEAEESVQKPASPPSSGF